MLIGLWTGDDLSLGYATAQLALHIARLVRPTSAVMLGAAIRPGYPEFVHCDEQKYVEAGYALFLEEERRRSA